jgi:TPR repeat protein
MTAIHGAEPIMRDDEVFAVAFDAFFALDEPGAHDNSARRDRRVPAREAYMNTIDEYRRAAEAGNRSAQEMLGLMYLYGSQLYGEGVIRDLREATRWLELAAAQDSVLARQLLRRYVQSCTDRGLGTPVSAMNDFSAPGLEAA